MGLLQLRGKSSRRDRTADVVAGHVDQALVDDRQPEGYERIQHVDVDRLLHTTRGLLDQRPLLAPPRQRYATGGVEVLNRGDAVLRKSHSACVQLFTHDCLALVVVFIPRR
jgi:hypothetical protein